ncbi:MAG: hypothetical protein Q9163_001015 [Psora crenata]
MPQRKDTFKGPRCSSCGKSERFYEEDGYQYCNKCGEQQEVCWPSYEGARALTLYLECYQLILWKQCYALVRTIGFPSRLESLVKDLWALRLQLLKGKVVAGESDGDTIFSSQPVSDANTQTEGGAYLKGRGKAMPTLIESLGICYLAAIMLRLPTSLGEMHRWAIAEDMPYIRAIRHVPAAMKKRLPAPYMLALDTTSPLERDHIRKAVHNLCLLYNHHFTITFPRLNAPLLGYKHIRNLALPIHTHRAVCDVAALLSVDFAFPLVGGQQRVSRLPEVFLISLIVIVVKLYHPFDTIDRFADSASDLAALTVDWASWLQAREQHELRLKDGGHLPRGTEINVTEQDVMKMTGEQLDDYLDWYERTWVDDERAEHKARGLPKQLLDMFPTGRQGDGSSCRAYDYRNEAEKQRKSCDQLILQCTSELHQRNILTDGQEDEGSVNRVGSFYKRYRSVDELTMHARGFHEAAASAVGIKLTTLLVAVRQVERRLIVWRERQLRVSDEGRREEGDHIDSTGEDVTGED